MAGAAPAESAEAAESAESDEAEEAGEAAYVEPDLSDTAAVVDYVVGAAKAESGGSPLFDEAGIRALVEHDLERSTNDRASTFGNHFAMEFTDPVRGGYGDIALPTLVAHGDRDPLFPLPHGEALAAMIPGAELLVLPGMGHAILPEPVWDVFVPALINHTAKPKN